MDGKMLEQVIQKIADDRSMTYLESQYLFIVVDCPVGVVNKSRADRKSTTEYLLNRINSKFKEAANKLLTATNRSRLSVIDVFDLKSGGSIEDELFGAIMSGTLICSDVHIKDKARDIAQSVETMDTEKGVPNLGNLIDYYVYVLQWPKQKMDSVRVYGCNLDDYVRGSLHKKN